MVRNIYTLLVQNCIDFTRNNLLPPQYPVFPFVLAKYDTLTLDLNALQSYRDLRRPMAIQDPSKEEHFMTTYNVSWQLNLCKLLCLS